MENHHILWVNPLLMAIFNSYVKLPEGTLSIHGFMDHNYEESYRAMCAEAFSCQVPPVVTSQFLLVG